MKIIKLFIKYTMNNSESEVYDNPFENLPWPTLFMIDFYRF